MLIFFSLKLKAIYLLIFEMDLVMNPRLSSNFPYSCLCFPSVEITGLSHILAFVVPSLVRFHGQVRRSLSPRAMA